MTDEFINEIVETGFEDLDVTAAVTVVEAPKVEAPGLTEAGLDALKALVSLPRGFGPPQMVALARDLAINILPLGTILTNHKLSNAQYEFLSAHNEFFKHALQQLASEWQGIRSTTERLRHEALAALEEQLPSIAGRMGKQSEKLIDAVEAAKLFARIANVDGGTAGRDAGGERFTISIDLGADTRLVLGNAGAEAKDTSPAGAGGVPKIIEGTRSTSPVPAHAKGAGST